MPRSLGLVNRLFPPCMLLTPPVGEEQFPVPLPSVPVGGRLAQFLHHWERFTTDVWVLSVIRGGLDLVFQERPPLSDSPIPMSQTSDKEKFRLLSEEVQSLLLKRVIEEIPPTQSTPGFYSRLFLVPKKTNWGNETCDRSLYSEQLPFCSPFQNGDQQIYQSLYSSRYVDHQTGPFGCLFPYPNFFGFQEISPICLEQQGLPISGGPVWPGGCTTGFYSGFPDGYSSPAYSVDSSSFLSGRFSSEGIRFRNSFSSYFPVYQTSSGPRLPYFLEKVSDTSFPRLPVFGGTLQDRFRSDFSPRGKFQSLCQKILIFSNSPSVMARQFSQLLGFLNSLADVVPLGRLHIRPLQFFLQEHWDSASPVWRL